MMTSVHSSSHMVGGLRPLSLLSWLRVALVTRRERRRLVQLDAAALDDIGVSRAEAEAEAARPLWDVPATWRR